MTASSPPVPGRSEATWAVLRARIAVALLLLYALASAGGWVKTAVSSRRASGADEISAYESRFQELRTALPAHGVVGYLGHPEPGGATPGARDAASLLHFKRYLLAQYALAPLVLIEGTEPEFVVGNFDPGSTPAIPAGFLVVRDFGQGLVLYRRSQ